MSNQANIYQFNKGLNSMPSKNGYVAVWRDIKKQSFYKDLTARGIFLDMLLDAQHKSHRIEVDGVQIFLNPGQLFTKRKYFVEQGIDDSKVKRVFAKLESLGIIQRETIKVGKRSVGQRVTFLNWSKWQKSDQSTDQSSDQPRTAEIKGLNTGCDQSTDQPSDQENNNVYNNNVLVSKDTCQNSDEFSPVQQKKIDKTPHQEIINLFGEILPSLPQPKKLTTARQKSIRARHVNDLKADINNWRKYFTYIRDNCQWMISGQYNVDFDYVIRQSTFVKVLEGAKDDRK